MIYLDSYSGYYRMDKSKIKIYLIIYGMILLISFTLGPYINVVDHKPVYSINCSEYNFGWGNQSSIEVFNETDIEVCGLENPLYKEVEQEPQLVLFNLT